MVMLCARVRGVWALLFLILHIKSLRAMPMCRTSLVNSVGECDSTAAANLLVGRSYSIFVAFVNMTSLSCHFVALVLFPSLRLFWWVV